VVGPGYFETERCPKESATNVGHCENSESLFYNFLNLTVFSTGILLCYCAGKYLNWSMLATLGACIPVPFLICMIFIPETPRWYFSKCK
jgi:hypothetical protein